MKHFTLLSFAVMFTFSLQGQVIFENGFEDWTGSAPDGWVGSKTQLPAGSIIQVIDDVYEGTSAVRLIKEGSGHQRFTTQPLTVSEGQMYTVNFWVRGQGDIRLGLFDDRATGSGYAPYTLYTNVSGNAWQEVSLTIAAATNATNAEFILSIQNTVAPEHLVVDDVTITEGGTVDPPTEATIQEIQTTSAPDGASPMVGETVMTSGVVTGIITGNNPGYFIQNGSGAWSGIFVFNDPGTLAIGHDVEVTGLVAEFNGQTQLTGISQVTVNSTGNMTISTVISTNDGNTEPYESVLVTVQNATVLSAGAFGQHTVNDGSGDVLVDDVFYAYPFVVGNIYYITGVLQYAFNEWRILPREVNDVELSTGIAGITAANVSLYPNPAIDILTLDLSGVDGRVEYQLFDASGRAVMSNVITSDHTMLNVGGLLNGIYALTLRTADNMWSTRVVVSH